MSFVQSICKRSVGIYLAALALCLLGLAALFWMPIAPFPSVTTNQLDVHLSYPGANTQATQSALADKVITALQGLDNIDLITGETAHGSANIHLILQKASALDVLQTKIAVMQAIAASHLPSIVPQAQVSQQADTAGLVSYILTSDHMSLFQISTYIKSQLEPSFKAIPGVQIDTVPFDGTINIQLDPVKLTRYHLDVHQVGQALDAATQLSPLGQVYRGSTSLPLNLLDTGHTLAQLKAIPITQLLTSHSLYPVTLSALGQVNFANHHLLKDFESHYNGHPSAALFLYTQSQANPFDVYKKSQAVIQTLRPQSPSDLKISVFDNQAQTMRDSFSEVLESLALACLLVVAISWLFLGNWRTTLMPIATLAVCLLGSVAVLAGLGESLNILTLLAMVIAAGLVVDDTIVVVENICSFMEQGTPLKRAIIDGTQQISLTVIGITATLLTVYLPLLMMHSSFATLLKAFTIPLAVAIFFSGVVALTLVPVLCFYCLNDQAPSSFHARFVRALQRMIQRYQRALHLVLDYPKTTLLILLVLIIGGGVRAMDLPQQFFPKDPSNYIDISRQGQTTDTVASIDQALKQFAPFYKQPTVKSYSTQIDRDPKTNRLMGHLRIQYHEQYLHQNPLFAAQINQFIQKKNTALTSATMENYSNWGHIDFEAALYGNVSVTQLNQLTKRISAQIKKSNLMSFVDTTANPPTMQLAFTFHRATMAALGITLPALKQALAHDFGGYQLARSFKIDGLDVPIIAQVKPATLRDPKALELITIESPNDHKAYPLSQFASWHLQPMPAQIDTINGLNSVRIVGNLKPGVSISAVIQLMNQLKEQMAPHLELHYFGQAQAYLQGHSESIWVACLGLFFTYAFLAILFNSLIDPFIILLTVPFSILGGMLSLSLFHDSLNLYSLLALITLIGLITKHGVLIVQWANFKLAIPNTSVRDAVLQATQQRFRPIIMTTLAMIFGALPLMLSQKLMYIARRDIGMVLISGLLVGTLFSLIIVPLVYTLVKKQPKVSLTDEIKPLS